MDAPLYSALRRHAALGRSSFHTPGHKNNPEALPGDLFSLDFTELPDTDSLYEDSGPIREAERKASALFQTARTCFSADGCTLCIQAMLRLAAPRGGKILCSRVIHRSAVNAMALLGIEPVWAMPRDIARASASSPGIQAVYVTSPDYYGRLLDLGPAAAACRARGIPLLVDCAHGAHLMFTDPVLHPLRSGASMTADSAHKTLGVLTGGAWLNIADRRYSADAKQAMALFGSTSPSYPVLASLDLARAWLEEHPGAFRLLEEKVREIRSAALGRGIRIPEGTLDPTRITLDTASAGVDGRRAADFFRSGGIEPEYADAGFVVLIATPFNTQEDFRRLKSAVLSLPLSPGKAERKPAELPPIEPAAAGLREAILGESESVEVSCAKGRIAAETACPCPPGVPVVMPGERISREAADFLSGYGILRMKVLK